MGSLMAGWNSPRSKKKFGRTLSLTREEIDQYWRNKRADQGQEEPPSPSSPGVSEVKKTMQKSNTFSAPEDEEPRYDRPGSLPILKSRTFNGRGTELKPESEMIVGSAPVGSVPPGWWTKTDLAFLNDRPVLEVVEARTKFNYVSQHPVARVKVDETSSSSTIVF